MVKNVRIKSNQDRGFQILTDFNCILSACKWNKTTTEKIYRKGIICGVVSATETTQRPRPGLNPYRSIREFCAFTLGHRGYSGVENREYSSYLF